MGLVGYGGILTTGTLSLRKESRDLVDLMKPLVGADALAQSRLYALLLSTDTLDLIATERRAILKEINDREAVVARQIVRRSLRDQHYVQARALIASVSLTDLKKPAPGAGSLERFPTQAIMDAIAKLPTVTQERPKADARELPPSIRKELDDVVAALAASGQPAATSDPCIAKSTIPAATGAIGDHIARLRLKLVSGPLSGADVCDLVHITITSAQKVIENQVVYIDPATAQSNQAQAILDAQKARWAKIVCAVLGATARDPCESKDQGDLILVLVGVITAQATALRDAATPDPDAGLAERVIASSHPSYAFMIGVQSDTLAIIVAIYWGAFGSLLWIVWVYTVGTDQNRLTGMRQVQGQDIGFLLLRPFAGILTAIASYVLIRVGQNFFADGFKAVGNVEAQPYLVAFAALIAGFASNRILQRFSSWIDQRVDDKQAPQESPPEKPPSKIVS